MNLFGSLFLAMKSYETFIINFLLPKFIHKNLFDSKFIKKDVNEIRLRVMNSFLVNIKNKEKKLNRGIITCSSDIQEIIFGF